MTDIVSDGRGFLKSAEIGVGNWAWGDGMFWGNRAGYSESDSEQAFERSMAAGITLVDTAESYGRGSAERLLGQFIHAGSYSREDVRIATKFMPFPWRLTKGTLRGALEASLRRLGADYVDLYQIHWPTPPIAIETWMDALADAVEAGLVRAVGVSNYSVEQTRRAHRALAARGVSLASNQVPFSLLDRRHERDGLLALCAELDIRVIAYSPLAQGLLTGKYTPDALPSGLRRLVFRRNMERAQSLVTIMREIGEKHGDKSPAQVALNWTICKGTLPIPGARNAQQADHNAGACGWRLSDEDIARLDAASVT